MTKNMRILAATGMVGFDLMTDYGAPPLQAVASGFRKTNDVPELLRTELLLGTAELRLSRAANVISPSKAHQVGASGRSRMKLVLVEAQRRGLPLLARQAQAVLEGEAASGARPRH